MSLSAVLTLAAMFRDKRKSRSAVRSLTSDVVTGDTAASANCSSAFQKSKNETHRGTNEEEEEKEKISDDLFPSAGRLVKRVKGPF